MTEIGLFIDPGEVTGWSTWMFDEESPLQRVGWGVTPGGRKGFMEEWTSRLRTMRPDLVVCEQFRLNGTAKDPSIEPTYIEGMLQVICFEAGLPEPEWQPINMKSMAPDDLLRLHGLYLKPSEVPMWEDGRDINDTGRHALAWALSTSHEPSLALYWPDEG